VGEIMAKYIEKRRRGWYAVMDVPEKLRKRIGRRRFVQSLQTESQSEAELLVHSVILGWKLELEEAKTGRPSPLAVRFRQDGLQWQRELKEAKGEAKEELEGLVVDMMAEAYYNGEHQLADNIDLIVRKGSVPLEEHLEEWLKKLDDVPKTIDMKRSAILAFAEDFQFTHQVNKRSVRTWAHNLQHNLDKPQSVKTIARKLSFLNRYWTYLQSAAIVQTEEEPFRNVLEKGGRKKTKAAASQGKWKVFTPAEVVRLLDQSKAANDTQLTAAILIAAWTGCRIEEICSLRIDNVLDDRLIIKDAKTEAGNREVPVHSCLMETTQELKRTTSDGYLISGLSLNMYGHRSNALGKRFHSMARSMGFQQGYVFHSIRKTVVTQLEEAEVPKSTIAAIIGHEEGRGITLGTYSRGPGLVVTKRAIEKLSYPGIQ
jgi:integrase